MLILSSLSLLHQRLNYMPICRIYIPRAINKIHDFKFPNQFMKDDLLIPPQQLKDGVVMNMVKEIRDNPEAEVHFKGIGLLLYHTGKQSIYDPLLIRRFEQNLFKYKNQFTSRLAFGAFHGFINLSVNNFYMQEFLEKEFIRNKEQIELREAVEMCEAIANNKSLTKEYLTSLIKETLQPIILKYYKKELKHNVGLQIRLFLALSKYQYFDKEIFEPLIQDVISNKKLRQLDTWLKIRGTLVQLSNDKVYKNDVSNEIKKLDENLQKKADFTWIYNFQENRYFTIQEMIAKRENYSHPDQRIGFYQRNQSMQEAFQKSKFVDDSEKERKIDQQEKEAELKQLLYNQYIKAKFGDIDSKELVDSEEINSFFAREQDRDVEGMVSEVEIKDEDLEMDEGEEEESGPRKSPKLDKKKLKKRKGRQGKVEKEDPLDDIE